MSEVSFKFFGKDAEEVTASTKFGFIGFQMAFLSFLEHVKPYILLLSVKDISKWLPAVRTQIFGLQYK